MELTFVWMPLALGGALATALAVFVILRRGRRAGERGTLAAAHADRLFRLPAYRWAFWRALAGLALLLVAVGTTITALTVIASRPVSAAVRDTELDNRDIVLCLDVSGSMAGEDAKVLGYFAQLAERFRGERIALVLWDANPVTVFPLTDDYPYIERALGELQAASDLIPGNGQEGDQPPLYAGTEIGGGSSKVGDGLASCVLSFDHGDDERSRTVVLGTDNESFDDSLLTLTEAVDLAVENDVRVYGLAPFPSTAAADMDDELRRTDGQVFGLGDLGGAQVIIDAVLSDQAATLDGVPQLAIRDEPGGWLLLAILGLWGVAAAVWVVRT
ncbi:MAG: VWA domain-containing protein [Actinomycetales bacterium]|nr:VWA domain-containing protein [Actinomycetales bacterium]